MVKVKVSEPGMVNCCGKRYYFNAGTTLNVPEECEIDFKAFSNGLDVLSERERKLLNKAEIFSPEETLAIDDLTTVPGIGKATAESIKEKLDG